MLKLFNEARRRKIFKPLGVYAVASWIIIQIADTVFPRLFMPSWTVTFVIILVIIGYPVTFFFAWVYDLKPDGIEVTPSASKTDSKASKKNIPKKVFLPLTGLLALIGGAFWLIVGLFDVTFSNSDEVPSVAIIPFENKGSVDDAFYAFGICADVISNVTSAGLIRVASLKQIEDLGDIPIDEKAKILDVRYIAAGNLWKLDNIFQLSAEIYDSKTSRVIWSERWQKDWDELPSITSDITENILNVLKVSFTENVTHIATSNSEAYEFYLKAKYKYEKRKNLEDTEIARGLLLKAIELDENLITAKDLLGNTYLHMGDYEKAKKIHSEILNQAEKIGNKRGIGASLNSLGIIYKNKGDTEKAMEHYTQSLNIRIEIGDKRGMGSTLNNIGILFKIKGEYDKAMEYYLRSLTIKEELGNKRGMGMSYGNIGLISMKKGDNDTALEYLLKSENIFDKLGDNQMLGFAMNNIGNIYKNRGEYQQALEYHYRTLEIHEELGNKRGIGFTQCGIGIICGESGDYGKAIESLEKSLEIQAEIGMKGLPLWNISTTYLSLAYKQLGLKYDEQNIRLAIENEKNIEFEMNFNLYKLLDDSTFLNTAYNQIQEKAEIMDNDLKIKFLNYPIQASIIREWTEINANENDDFLITP